MHTIQLQFLMRKCRVMTCPLLEFQIPGNPTLDPIYIDSCLTTQGHGWPPWMSDRLIARNSYETTRTHRQRHNSLIIN